ncbi:MAG TPA: von Willebrand factor type A domain-containing protein [Candidatus Udaeobacter sp.]|nr:von Willebrand factor type A domain-containing protein [Candidatus Udaeobacter sp.]
MNIDDPKLTAFALGELDEPERSAVARAVAESAEAQRFVAEIRELARTLRSEYETELGRETPVRMPVSSNLIDIRGDPWFWSIARPLAIAAVLALLAVVSGVAVFSLRRENVRVAQGVGIGPLAVRPKPADVQAQFEMPTQVAASPARTASSQLQFAPAPLMAAKQSASKVGSLNYSLAQAPGYAVAGADRFRGIREPSGEFNTAAYDHIVENPFLDAKDNPLSTFSIDVDTASYSNVRRFINEGSLPPKDAVRVEEMINYFTYDYAQPSDGKPFAVHVDVASCPWETSHRLVRIGLKGKEIATDKRGLSNLVFLLDVSGSMMPPERLPLVKQAMRLLVEKLTENDRVAIVVYAGASGLALPSTAGDHKEQILEALENLQAGGSTNGAEGIELAYKIAADNFIQGGVNRVILATDGDFNVGVTNQGDLIHVIEEKAKSGVFLSVLGVGTDNLKDSTMQKLADKGNGNYAYLDSLDEARKVLVQQMNGTLVTIAKDVKIQVEFNPARVASYRLIGYEKRMLRKEDFNNDKVDAGEIGAGHTVTALYEVVPVGAATNPAASVPPVDPLKYSLNERPTSTQSTVSNEMLTVKLRYKKPDGNKSELVERAVTDTPGKFENAPADLKFAAAVAEFGMILRDSEYKGNGTFAAVLEWAQEGRGSDTNGYRSGFIELVRKAQAVKRG